MRRAILITAWLITAAFGASAMADRVTVTANDVADLRSNAYALTRASVQINPQQQLENATLLIRDGEVISVIANGPIPHGYVEIELEDRFIYPGLIDLDSGYGLEEPAKPVPYSYGAAEVLGTQTPGAYNANQAIRAEYRAAAHFSANQDLAKTYRQLGFGAVLTHRADGIARGTGALVSTGEGSANELLIAADAAAFYSFNKGNSAQSYPRSPMGAIALIRQTHLDASWYAQQDPKPFSDLSLAAWLRSQSLPQIIVAEGWQASLRADQLGDEFGVQYIIKGSGNEYQRINAIKATRADLIIPLNFPDAPDVSDPLAADSISFAALKHWELAPGNPAALARAGVVFAITSGADKDKFWQQLRLAIEHGLSAADALAALTTIPAAMLELEGRLGVLKTGAIANFLVTSGELFDPETVIEDNWIQGHRYGLNPHPIDHSGSYEVLLGAAGTFIVEVSGKPGEHEASIAVASGAEAEEDDPKDDPKDNQKDDQKDDQNDDQKNDIEVKIDFEKELLTLSFSPKTEAPAIRLSGWIEADGWKGRGQLGDGSWIDWSARRLPPTPSDSDADDSDDEKQDKTADLGPIIYPFTAYGRETLATARDLVLRNATVWTNEADGILKHTDVLLVNGKIAAVGKDLEAGDTPQLDASGKHLTSGIIDEHSHIALVAINDVATNSAMVRMADVVDSEDVNIYRNLAGGVTAAQLLHGSANPVGGQSALVKFRWGSTAENMLIQGADGFIKFALGENVKRSSNNASIRYPQTRMGVEQVYRSTFSAARDYQQAWANYQALSRRQQARRPAPRRDLVLEAMVEILNSERHISCHSYVQSEINMLMQVANDFGFKINTFTHILEGYKVADKMARHGAGGSTFSDWWAYKWEVRYAIPYNAALMSEAGVVVAINSDSSEMSRRLNQEAAKSVKYGGMSEEEAFKLISLNPAKLLHLDHRMGSIRVGKDADLVLWSDNPLSIYARVEKTWVDGALQFDLEDDLKMRDWMRQERARLVGKIGASEGGKDKDKDKGNGKGGAKPDRIWQCDSHTGYEYLQARNQR